MKKFMKWLLPISGLWIIGLGIYTIFTPLASLVLIATMLIMFGIAMIFSGVSEVVSFFAAGKGNRSGMMIASGLLTTLFGVWVIFGRGLYGLALILPFIFAAWIMSSGITRIVGSMPSRSETSKFRFWQFLLGAITTMAGFSLLFNPFMSAAMITFIMPIMLISYGMGTIELFFRLRRAEKQQENEPEIVEEVPAVEVKK